MTAKLIGLLAAGLAAFAGQTPACAKDTVKIAFIGPLTGGNAAAGVGGRNSALLAVQQRNADAAAKYAYELVPLDDECKPNVGVQVATKAASDRAITAGVTHYCSAVGIATVDTYAKFRLPVVVWGAILPEITYGNAYKQIHRVNGTMINEGRLAAKFLTEQGAKSFVVVHDTTDYGKGQNKYFSEFLKPTGGEILATFPVSPDQQDFTAELTRIKELKPDYVFVGGLTPLGVRVRSQMDRVGVEARMAGVTFQRCRLMLEQTVFDNIALGVLRTKPLGVFAALFARGKLGRDLEATIERARRLASRFNPALGAALFRPAGELTMIDRRRVEICRALISNPRLLLLDEPSAGMTPDETRRLMDDLLAFREEAADLAVVLVEHEMDVIRRVSDRCVVLNFGRKIFEGGFDAMIEDDQVQAAYLGSGR